jgi:hypothetical protein
MFQKEEMMEKLAKFLGKGLLGIVMVGLLAVAGGTILWIVWPAAASVFPTMIREGLLVSRISWWQAVALLWGITLIFKTSKPSVETKDEPKKA